MQRLKAFTVSPRTLWQDRLDLPRYGPFYYGHATAQSQADARLKIETRIDHCLNLAAGQRCLD
jgi:hypothetical protein